MPGRSGRSGASKAPRSDAEEARRAVGPAADRRDDRRSALRAAVLEILADARRPMTAYAVAGSLAERSKRKVDPNAVAAASRLFSERGLLHRVESVRGYVAVPAPLAGGALVSLVCRHCGRAHLVRGEPLFDRVKRRAAEADFAPARIIVEVLGACPDCRRRGSGLDQAERP